MPHISITILPGCTQEQKVKLARRLKDTMSCLLGIAPVTISVSIKDLPMKQWDEFITALSDNEIIIPETFKEYKCPDKTDEKLYS